NLAASLILTAAQPSLAQAQQEAFASPEQASKALYEAVRNKDDKAVQGIFGELASTTDQDQDKLERERFAQKYQEMHRLVREPDGTTVLYIGAENWPFPIPLVSKNGAWYFDSDTGKQEILFRRVGENEATGIEVSEDFAMTKNGADAKAASEDPITRFAESLSSASAVNAGSKESNPFHGYYFRVVGVSGPGNARRGLKS